MTSSSSSRSSSPHIHAGWSTPAASARSATPDAMNGRHGLPTTTTTAKSYGQLNGDSSWESARFRSAKVHAYASRSSPSQSGFLRRNLRNLSVSLPRFNLASSPKDYSDREKLGRGRWHVRLKNLAIRILRIAWRLRLLFAIILAYIFAMLVWYKTPLHALYRHHPHLGGGSRFTVILGTNHGGGVMEWKGPREWAIERESLKNKRKYVKRHGYNLAIIDMATKKRYAHEWRESWEKVDAIRRMMRQHPESEWFWWLDLTTFVMEPSISLQKQIFDNLAANTYRDINVYNPLNISHPFTEPWLEPLSRSLKGDEDPASINLIIPQDCSGFNLGSFFVRRSEWTYRLLDMWWDPVQYEQRHMQWEHKEQDALEYLYTSHPWIRPHTAFLPLRKASSFPPGACGENNSMFHYNKKDRDFMMSMAGCEWGRDCWGEIYTYRELSNYLNRTYWEKFKDGLGDIVRAIIRFFRPKPKEEDKKT